MEMKTKIIILIFILIVNINMINMEISLTMEIITIMTTRIMTEETETEMVMGTEKGLLPFHRFLDLLHSGILFRLLMEWGTEKKAKMLREIKEVK